MFNEVGRCVTRRINVPLMLLLFGLFGKSYFGFLVGAVYGVLCVDAS